MATAVDDIFKQAIALFQAGRLTEAESTFRKVLHHQPKNVAALNLLSVLLTHSKRYAEAELFIKTAIEVNANSDATFYNYGLILKALKRPHEAFECFNRALSINANYAATWNSRGTIFNDLNCYDDAIADFNKAIALQPNNSESFYNKGKSLAKIMHYDEALTAFAKALALKPELAEAWLGRGNVFSELKRHDEAIAAYDKALALKSDLEGAWLGRGNVFFGLKRYDEAFAAFDKALALNPDLAEAWLSCGNVFSELKRHDEATAAYNKALVLRPDLEGAWLGRGNVFSELKRHDEAFAAYDKALALNSDLEGAWLGRGNVFFDLKRFDDALAAYGRALSLNPEFAEAWFGRGNVYFDLKRFDEALVAYDKAIKFKSDLSSLEGLRLQTKMYLCDWGSFEADFSHLITSVRNGNVNPPFSLLGIPSSAEDQIACARRWVANRFPSKKPVWRGERYGHSRIRVAYISADFSEHPMSFLMAGVFECHDRSRFHVTAISLGPNDSSEMRQRLNASFEQFIEAEDYSDDKIANLIKQLEIDILVDLMGFTANSRTNILAMRAAPIQINYLGYLGTMGADFVDYLIADETLIPVSDQRHYSEQIVYLPHSFQANDRNRRISKRIFTRLEMGLPEEDFVYCCFNNNYKITPDVFDIWMRVLKQADGSVLWLVDGGKNVTLNLRNRATASGINAERLIFAKRAPYAEHLSRLRLADLFLDTLPYNAGATASDALWAGLPVLTRIGHTLAGRMGASLLNAINLPELITATPEAYEEMAIDLAANPEKLAVIRRNLADNRLSTPLFDTGLFTKHIEAAYSAMYERFQGGSGPNHIVVPNL